MLKTKFYVPLMFDALFFINFYMDIFLNINMEIDWKCGVAKFSPHPNKSNNFCSVFGCNSRSCCDPDIRFHCFPSEKSNKGNRTCWPNK